MAKLAENKVAVDAELDEAILRGRAAHGGQEGNDGPVGRGRSFVLLPIHLSMKLRRATGEPPFQLLEVYVSTLKTPARGH